MKECGDCAVCCYHCNVPEMNSPAGEMCSKNTGTGCSIYENRPAICRPFKCLWLAQEQLPDDLRPDRCGVMFETPFQCDTWIGYVDPKFPDALEQENVQTLVDKIVAIGHSVVIYWPNGDKKYALAKGVSKEMMHTQVNNAVVTHSPEGI